jgi:hypothetical protein
LLQHKRRKGIIFGLEKGKIKQKKKLRIDKNFEVAEINRKRF